MTEARAVLLEKLEEFRSHRFRHHNQSTTLEAFVDYLAECIEREGVLMQRAGRGSAFGAMLQASKPGLPPVEPPAGVSFATAHEARLEAQRQHQQRLRSA